MNSNKSRTTIISLSSEESSTSVTLYPSDGEYTILQRKIMEIQSYLSTYDRPLLDMKSFGVDLIDLVPHLLKVNIRMEQLCQGFLESLLTKYHEISPALFMNSKPSGKPKYDVTIGQIALAGEIEYFIVKLYSELIVKGKRLDECLWIHHHSQNLRNNTTSSRIKLLGEAMIEHASLEILLSIIDELPDLLLETGCMENVFVADTIRGANDDVEGGRKLFQRAIRKQSAKNTDLISLCCGYQNMMKNNFQTYNSRYSLIYCCREKRNMIDVKAHLEARGGVNQDIFTSLIMPFLSVAADSTPDYFANSNILHEFVSFAAYSRNNISEVDFFLEKLLYLAPPNALKLRNNEGLNPYQVARLNWWGDSCFSIINNWISRNRILAKLEPKGDDDEFFYGDG